MDSTKAAGVYEAIKNKGRHELIITLSEKSAAVESLLLSVLNGLKDKDDPHLENVEIGLHRIASKTTLPRYMELDAGKVKKFLHALAADKDFEIVLTTSEISSHHSLYSVEVDGDKNDEKTAMQLVLRAAFKESDRRGLSKNEFMDECTMIFDTKYKYYESAFSKVTGQNWGKAGNDEGKMSIENWIEQVLDLVDEGTQILNNTQEQTNSDSESEKTYKSHCDAMKTAALSALVKWYELTGISSTDVVDISDAIFAPVE